MKITKTLHWIIKLVPAIILLQTLYFKFSAAPESVALFTKIGLEPYGRVGIGVVELIAAILILIPRTTVYGAILGLGLMFGALKYHLTDLGIEVGGDGGKVFYLAVVTAIFCVLLIIIHRKEIISLFSKNKMIDTK
jgi:hypothetical protein